MKLSIREMTVFAMLGAIMYASKVIMEALPNVHLLGVFTAAITIVYRKKALYAIYTFVFLSGLFAGFSMWWMPYLYIWAILWGMVMLLPKKMSDNKKAVLAMVLCSLHGFLYGTLYAPFQALMFGLGFEQMISWIIAGLPFDIIHGISNLFCGILILPVVKALRKAENAFDKN